MIINSIEETAVRSTSNFNNGNLDRLLATGPFGDSSSMTVARDIAAAQIDFSDNHDEVVQLLKRELSRPEANTERLIKSYQFRLVAHATALNGNSVIAPTGHPLEGWLPAAATEFKASRMDDLRLSVLQAESDASVGALLTKLFNKHIRPAKSVVAMDLIDVPDVVASGIQGGLNILASVCPESAKSNLDHVSLACVYSVDGKIYGKECDSLPCMESVSCAAVKSAAFFFSAAITEPWLAAELIYHESIHNKMFDLFISPGLLISDHERNGCVISEWNEDLEWRTNVWPFDQALGAYHVYVHLMQFFLLASKQPHSAKLHRHLQKQLGGAIARSGSIEQQMDSECRNYLTDHGIEFFKWLQSSRRAICSQL